jgi:hypothetical protein
MIEHGEIFLIVFAIHEFSIESIFICTTSQWSWSGFTCVHVDRESPTLEFDKQIYKIGISMGHLQPRIKGSLQLRILNWWKKQKDLKQFENPEVCRCPHSLISISGHSTSCIHNFSFCNVRITAKNRTILFYIIVASAALSFELCEYPSSTMLSLKYLFVPPNIGCDCVRTLLNFVTYICWSVFEIIRSAVEHIWTGIFVFIGVLKLLCSPFYVVLSISGRNNEYSPLLNFQ